MNLRHCPKMWLKNQNSTFCYSYHRKNEISPSAWHKQLIHDQFACIAKTPIVCHSHVHCLLEEYFDYTLYNTTCAIYQVCTQNHIFHNVHIKKPPWHQTRKSPLRILSSITYTIFFNKKVSLELFQFQNFPIHHLSNLAKTVLEKALSANDERHNNKSFIYWWAS